MTVVAELTIPAAEFALGETLAEIPEAVVEFERIVTHSQEWVMPFLWVRGGDLERFDELVRRDPTVVEAAVAERFDRSRLYVVEWSAEVRTSVNVIFDQAGTLVEATGNRDRWEILVRFDRRDGLSELQAHFDRSNTAFTLQRILSQAPRGAEFEVSPRQREAIVTAVEMGYYDIPRRTELSAIADRLGITTSSASERLRRGVVALTENTLLVGELDEERTEPADGGRTSS